MEKISLDSSYETIQRKLDLLKGISEKKIELDLSSYVNFASIKSQQSKSKELFPPAIPNLIGATSDCLQCFYGFQLDTYVNGCTHECVYCWAKSELSKVNSWNNPIPIPVDITALWEILYTAFETDKKFPLRDILLKRVPIRIGSMSDPFLAMEKKYKITLQVLKILKKYNYPFLILTRSAMVAEDEYIELMDSTRTSIQFSIPSLNEKFVSILEPGADPSQKRLEALKKLNQAGIWSSVRLNPLFPIYPDGHFSNQENVNVKNVPAFDFFNFDMINEISSYGCKSLLAGFVHMDGKTLKTINQKIGHDLRNLMKDEIKETTEGFKFSKEEVRAYYELISKKCKEAKMSFSTCYLGLGESYFWKDQDLWADKEDCCNIKKNVQSFKTDTQQISIASKLKILYPMNSNVKYFFIAGWFYKMRSYILKKIFT